MSELPITGVKDFDISGDGQRVVLNLLGQGAEIISLRVDAITLQTIAQQIGFALTKARQLASANPNFVPALRPAKFRADVIADGKMVVVVFALTDKMGGLEHYYGLLPDESDALAQQMRDSGVRARQMTAAKETKH
jgi:hypothetical protein